MGRASIKFVCGKPALRSGGVLAVADLHLGLERELDAKGVRAAGLAERMRGELVSLVREEEPETLVVVGDVKHSICGDSRAGAAEAKALFGELSSLCEVVVVRGNHDAGLDAGPGVGVADSRGIVLGGVGFAHGHAWPCEEVWRADFLVVGHVHPCVEVVDASGAKGVERAWLLAKAEKKALLSMHPGANPGIGLVVMPAFNPLLGGVFLNRPGAGFSGPVFGSGIFKLAGGQIFLLDGVGLGSPKP